MKKHFIFLTFAAAMLATMLLGCHDAQNGKVPMSTAKQDTEETISLTEVTYGNESTDAAIQMILENMLAENSDASHIMSDLAFDFNVEDQICMYTVVDSDVIDSKGAIKEVTEDTNVNVYVKYRGGECYFTFTVLSPTSASYAVMEQVADNMFHNMDNVRDHISLPATAGKNDEISIIWASSNPDVITDTATGEGDVIPAGYVTRGAKDTVVTLTAELTNGTDTITREYELTVKAAPIAKEYTKYVYTYFQANIYGNGESQHIHMATSEDGFFWDSLNNDEYILEATLGTGGVRDPFLLRSSYGDHFYLIGTDLDANGGDWASYGNEGSHYIYVWESDDLVNWSEPRLVRIAPSNAGCTWAPESTYDPTTGEYVVYWSTGLKGSGKQIWYAKTRDFYTFTEPQVYKPFSSGTTYIDTTMIEYDGRYYRFTKNENNLTILLETSDAVLGDYSLVKTVIADEYGVEGPSIYQVFGEEKWVLYMDGYADENSGVGYFPLIAESLNDLQNANFRRLSEDEFEMPLGAKHGSFMPITDEEYNALLEKWGDYENRTIK
ncbi:MAG: hypothetical protein E7269_01290 [Lachnospiraceae bacterium]|nr:hypothetical protein [Lachnospiraceae bacterium]